jgi:hypothetical protein
LITKCNKPKVIFLAHFDTPTIMPFWIPPIYRLFGHTKQIPVMLLLIVLLWAPLFLDILVRSTLLNAIIAVFHLMVAMTMFSLLIPNPHNREDNTSGVIGLLALADWAKDKPGVREHVQFAFVDNEELGLLGSKGLKRLWDKQKHPYSDAAIISLDCISRGQKPLVIYHKDDTVAQQVSPFLQKHLPEAQTVDMGIIPLSDNYTFRKASAVNISFADPSLIPGGHYIPKIHVPADNDFSPANLSSLVAGLTEFLLHETSDSSIE